MENIKQFFKKNDKFAEYVGVELLEVTEGKAKARLPITEQHLNGLNIVHGAAIFTLADLVFAAAANSRGIKAVGIHSTISYLKAANPGVLIAEAKEISVNPKLATYMVEIMNDNNDLIAIFQGTAYIKKTS